MRGSLGQYVTSNIECKNTIISQPPQRNHIKGCISDLFIYLRDSLHQRTSCTYMNLPYPPVLDTVPIFGAPKTG